MTDGYHFVEADKVRSLCRSYQESMGSTKEKARAELIQIAMGRHDGSINIAGEDGADRDDAIRELAMTVGGPW